MKQHIEYCMGTAFVFQYRSDLVASKIEDALSRAMAILHETDRIFSLYKPESDLSRLSRGETSVAQCEPVVEEVWQLCERWEKTTDGWFSPFTPQHTFDPSGLVKTWAAQKAFDLLVAAGITDLTMNAGGDILIGNGATEDLDWRVGISKPISIADQDAGTVTVVDLKGTRFRAVATSGTAERGKHIWNPKNPDEPADQVAQVTVIANDLVKADVWATAAFAMGERAVGILDTYNQNNLEDHIQLLVQLKTDEPDELRLAATRGFEQLFAKPTN